MAGLAGCEHCVAGVTMSFHLAAAEVRGWSSRAVELGLMTCEVAVLGPGLVLQAEPLHVLSGFNIIF